MTPEPPYTVAEVAARWRVSRWTIQALCRDGTLYSIPGLRHRRIPRAAVRALEEGYYPTVAHHGIMAAVMRVAVRPCASYGVRP